MKTILVLCFSLFSLAATAASEVKVELTSGFHAAAYPAVATGAGAQAYGYSVLGGTLIQAASGDNFRFSVDCTGFDQMVDGKTTGLGHCAWSDVDGDHLYVSLSTGHEGNRYRINGGSGKWSDASGTIDTHFTYLPSPRENLYLGVEEGRGTLSLPSSRSEP